MKKILSDLVFPIGVSVTRDTSISCFPLRISFHGSSPVRFHFPAWSHSSARDLPPQFWYRLILFVGSNVPLWFRFQLFVSLELVNFRVHCGWKIWFFDSLLHSICFRCFSRLSGVWADSIAARVQEPVTAFWSAGDGRIWIRFCDWISVLVHRPSTDFAVDLLGTSCARAWWCFDLSPLAVQQR
jgi:hypothetical protein